jgi:prevent-host-death family protein
MDMRITIHAAKTNLSRLIEKACSGEEVVIARGDTPVVRLTPIAAPSKARQFGAMKGRARTGTAFFEPLPEAELRTWEK